MKRRNFLNLSIKTFMLLGVFSYTLFSQNIKNIKENTMDLAQKAREIFEKLLGGAKKEPLLKSDKEYFSNHINFTFGESFKVANLNTQTYFLITLGRAWQRVGKWS